MNGVGLDWVILATVSFIWSLVIKWPRLGLSIVT
jgi:hypothetical protein